MRKRVTKIAAIALFGALPLAAIADDGHRGRGYGGTGYWDHGRDYRHPAKHHRYYGRRASRITTTNRASSSARRWCTRRPRRRSWSTPRRSRV
jgi:hypothetical protein